MNSKKKKLVRLKNARPLVDHIFIYHLSVCLSVCCHLLATFQLMCSEGQRCWDFLAHFQVSLPVVGWWFLYQG